MIITQNNYRSKFSVGALNFSQNFWYFPFLKKILDIFWTFHTNVPFQCRICEQSKYLNMCGGVDVWSYPVTSENLEILVAGGNQ